MSMNSAAGAVAGADPVTVAGEEAAGVEPLFSYAAIKQALFRLGGAARLSVRSGELITLSPVPVTWEEASKAARLATESRYSLSPAFRMALSSARVSLMILPFFRLGAAGQFR